MNEKSITERVYARIGLLGNPSDSYYGKTLSLSLANFFAEVLHYDGRLALVSSLDTCFLHSSVIVPQEASGGAYLLYMQVTLKPSDSIQFVPHLLHDGGAYSSWDTLVSRVDGEGYSGGVRLLKAMCKIFFQDCQQRGLELPQQHFELSYETNIPRQSGLSGSSAIACAAFNCLLAFYSLGNRCAPTTPSHVLI